MPSHLYFKCFGRARRPSPTIIGCDYEFAYFIGLCRAVFFYSPWVSFIEKSLFLFCAFALCIGGFTLGVVFVFG